MLPKCSELQDWYDAEEYHQKYLDKQGLPAAIQEAVKKAMVERPANALEFVGGMLLEQSASKMPKRGKATGAWRRVARGKVAADRG